MKEGNGFDIKELTCKYPNRMGVYPGTPMKDIDGVQGVKSKSKLARLLKTLFTGKSTNFKRSDMKTIRK